MTLIIASTKWHCNNDDDDDDDDDDGDDDNDDDYGRENVLNKTKKRHRINLLLPTPVEWHLIVFYVAVFRLDESSFFLNC